MLSHFKAIKVEINRGDAVDTVFGKNRSKRIRRSSQ
jgi:hypothetical protein